MPEPVDGNSLAGPLSELFSADLTLATARCLGCGDVSELARARVYPDPTGYVVRCGHCDEVLMIVVEKVDSICLELRGMSWLTVPR
ncbi:MAG: DUF6510 family protein [Actinomycetota bacterium]